MIEPSLKLIRVFVASPGDVKQERDITKLVVEELNRSTARDMEVRLECLRWEDYVAPSMGRPEGVILEQLALGQWDIFIGILWLRFGTPTGGTKILSGEPYLSGTEEEFTLAYQAWRDKGRPHILMYRCTRPPVNMVDFDADQYSRVSNFFGLFDHDKEHPGLVRVYQDVSEFERRVREDIISTLRRIMPVKTIEYGPDLNAYHQAHGFLRLFLPENNRERNNRKNTSLQSTQSIRLLAYTGNSYLGLVSHKFRETIMARLSQGSTFRVILNNPWTLTRFFIALADIKSNSHSGSNIEAPMMETINPIQVIEQTVGFSTSFKDILDGYQYLRQHYGDLVEVRFTKDVIPATVLLTDGECFFEPYLHNDFRERMHKRMASFEIQMTKEASMFNHISDLFEFMWNRAELYTSFMSNEERYKNELVALLRQDRSPS